MRDNNLIKYETALIKNIGKSISITNKLLALAEPKLIPYRKGNKWGFCTEDLKLVIDCDYDSADLFYENMAVVSKNGKYGFINKQGEIVIDLEYDNADSFFENLSIIEKSGKKGVINKINQLIVEPIFDKLYYNGVFELHKKVGLMDINFLEIIPPTFLEIGTFSDDGLASFISDCLFGYINRDGAVVISPRFHYAGKFKNGVAVVANNEQYYLIDFNGNKIINNSFKYLEPPFEKESNLYAFSKDDLHYGFLDEIGNEIIPPIYDFVELFSEGLACVYKDGKAGFIDKNNSLIIEFEFDKGEYFSEGLARVARNGKQGFIDKKGKEIIPFLYEENTYNTSFEDGYASVVHNNRCGIIDKTGKIIIPFEYTSIYYIYEINMFMVYQNEAKHQFISTKGVKYWED